MFLFSFIKKKLAFNSSYLYIMPTWLIIFYNKEKQCSKAQPATKDIRVNVLPRRIAGLRYVSYDLTLQ